MAKTPISGSDAYAEPSDLFVRIDPRVVADWVSVNGARVGATGDAAGTVNEATLALSTKILTALKTASGVVESYVFRGGKYSSADLTALTGNCAELLKDIVCGVALKKIAGFRLAKNDDAMLIYQEAMEHLNRLNTGENIFSLQEAADAGRISSDRMTQQEILTNNGVGIQYDRYFGRTPDRNSYPYG